MKLWFVRIVNTIVAAAFIPVQAKCVFAQAPVKEPNVAGAFYPSDAAELAAMIDGYLKAAESTGSSSIDADIFGLISPHAGYQYSGPTAACGYRQLQGRNYKTVIVMGPSHSAYFKGVSVYARGSFKTPLGIIEIDWPFAAQVLAYEPSAVFEPSFLRRSIL